MNQDKKRLSFIRRLGDKITPRGLGYCLFVDYEINGEIDGLSDEEVLGAFIRFLFYEPKPENAETELYNGLNLEELKKLNGITYGFYEGTRITSSDYRTIEPETFYEVIEQNIGTFTEDTEFAGKIPGFFGPFINQETFINHLVIDKENNPEKMSEWSVHDCFEAFILINRSKGQIVLVEMGAD